MGHSSGQGQRAACAIVVAALAAGISVSAQRSPSVPRTSDGHPDVQGLWNSGTLTPLQRPKEFAGREFMTAEEAADFEAHALDRLRAAIAAENKDDVLFASDLDYTFLDRLKVVDRRTSLITDQPDFANNYSIYPGPAHLCHAAHSHCTTWRYCTYPG